MIKIYVPKDSAARAVGADAVADAIVAEAAARKIDVQDYPQWFARAFVA